ncbi:MAG: N-acetylmuramoyl-L-alanine amidase family protein [Anaerorhabdus sp.]|uniref:peptidoglycan recognition protein family protein n=1 Tax=Anaerorhabdus sp. TaxID=1872524 RepID=UPI003A8884F7
MKLIEQLINPAKYRLKCPYVLDWEYITIHETGNDQSAQNEINYMQRNNNATGFHIAVDDKVAIIGIPLDRNAWHAGDGANGTGNRKSIGVEICYQTDYTDDKYYQAWNNAAEVVKWLRKLKNIPIENVVQHNHWNGKDCPKRTRQEGTWDKFLSLCKEEATGGEGVGNFKEGYQSLSLLGSIVHVYKKKLVQKLGMMSAEGSIPERAVQNIDKIDNEFIHWCKINCGYFEMENKAIYGQHYGVEQSFTNDFAPKQNDWLVAWLDKDNSMHYDTANNYWLWKKDVQCAFSPAVIMSCDGKIELVSKAVGYSKVTNKTTQSVLIELPGKEYVFAVFTGNVNLLQVRDFAKSYGAVMLYALDSGGSAQMISEGAKKRYTGRAIPNVLTFFTGGEQEPVEPSEPVQPSDPTEFPNQDLKRITVIKIGLYIRESLGGKIIGFIPEGAYQDFNYIKFIDGMQKDGYQHCEVNGNWSYKGVEYKNKDGFIQYDSSCYLVSE